MLSRQLLHWLSDCIVDAYLEDCRDRELAPKTVDWYGYHLRRARDWLHAQPAYHALGILDPDQLAAYYRSTRNLSTNTRRHMVNALRAFGSWLKRHGLDCPAADLQRPRRPKRLPVTIPPLEVQRLLQILDDEPLREQAIVYLMLDAGLRCSEVAKLQRHHLDLARGQVMIRDAKGRKDRVAYYSDTTSHLLARLLASHIHSHLFVADRRPHRPLTANAIAQALRRLARRHDFQRLNPHLLRRTSGTEYHANGVDLDIIGDQFGHEDLVTTRDYYARLADDRRRDIIRRASPVERFLDHGIPAPEWPRR